MEGLSIIGIASVFVFSAVPGALEGSKPFEGKNFNPSLHPRLQHDLGQICLALHIWLDSVLKLNWLWEWR